MIESKSRAIRQMYFVDEITPIEIAKVLGVTKQYVYKVIKDACVKHYKILCNKK